MAGVARLRRDKADGAPDGDRLLTPASAKRKSHQVRVQGRLVLVRSVSAVNLGTASLPSVATPTSAPPSPYASASAIPAVPPLPSPAPGGSKTQTHKRQSQLRRRSMGSPGIAGAAPGPVDASSDATVPDAAARYAAEAGWDTIDLGNDLDGAYDGAYDGRRRRRRRRRRPSDSETEEDEQETALRDRQWRGYGIGGAGNIRRPTEVVQFYSSSDREGSPSGHRRRWQWMSSLLGRRGRKDKEPVAETDAVTTTATARDPTDAGRIRDDTAIGTS